MYQPRGYNILPRGPYIPRGSYGGGSSDCRDDRRDEKRAAMAQMLAENSEGLGMKVIAVMVQRYGVLPKEMWVLNSISDMGAGRGINYVGKISKPKGKNSKSAFERVTSNSRYTIINLTISVGLSQILSLPDKLMRLNVAGRNYKCPFDLPLGLQELTFRRDCKFNLPLALPHNLRKLALGNRYNLPIALPSGLVELELGAEFIHPLSLPLRLKRLAFAYNSKFNLPLTLPSGLVDLQLGDFYNQPTLLPPGLQEIRVGTGFRLELSLPSTLRKIVWCCNHPIHNLPESVQEVKWSSRTTRDIFTHPSTLQHLILSCTGCEVDLSRHRIRKMTIGGSGIRIISWPQGLKELAFTVDAIGYTLRIPKGCELVGEKRPTNVITE